jgi:hypothetical protein
MKLLSVLNEIKEQESIGEMFPESMQSFAEQISQLYEYIEIVGEYGVAYELLVSMLERFPFILHGRVVINLLEVGLIFGFKTDCLEDEQFDRRSRKA